MSEGEVLWEGPGWVGRMDTDFGPVPGVNIGDKYCGLTAMGLKKGDKVHVVVTRKPSEVQGDE